MCVWFVFTLEQEVVFFFGVWAKGRGRSVGSTLSIRCFTAPIIATEKREKNNF